MVVGVESYFSEVYLVGKKPTRGGRVSKIGMQNRTTRMENNNHQSKILDRVAYTDNNTRNLHLNDLLLLH